LSAGGRSYVGIDVSKATLDVAILPAREHFVVSNDEAGIDELLGKLLAEEEVSDDALVVLEASGGFERPLVAALPPRRSRCSCSTLARRGTSPKLRASSPRPTG
jgi:hypothetical protein